jgi:hypothetical protein
MAGLAQRANRKDQQGISYRVEVSQTRNNRGFVQTLLVGSNSNKSNLSAAR